MFTFRERWERDAAARARVEGEVNTADKVLKLLESGVNPSDVVALLREMKNEYGGKKEVALS